MGLVLGGLRPASAKATHCIDPGDKHCPNVSGDVPFCCPPDAVCCTNGVTNACCGAEASCQNGTCVYPEDPCGPDRYLCPDGCCPDKNNCCGGKCCIEGQVCVNGRCKDKCPNGRDKCGKQPRCCPRGKKCRKGKCR